MEVRRWRCHGPTGALVLEPGPCHARAAPRAARCVPGCHGAAAAQRRGGVRELRGHVGRHAAVPAAAVLRAGVGVVKLRPRGAFAGQARLAEPLPSSAGMLQFAGMCTGDHNRRTNPALSCAIAYKLIALRREKLRQASASWCYGTWRERSSLCCEMLQHYGTNGGCTPVWPQGALLY